jgi:hypothetical protein
LKSSARNARAVLFTDPGELVQGKVPIVKSRTVKQMRIRVARDAEIFTGE